MFEDDPRAEKADSVGRFFPRMTDIGWRHMGGTSSLNFGATPQEMSPEEKAIRAKRSREAYWRKKEWLSGLAGQGIKAGT